MRVAVVGAGPAGITAAYQLAKRGVQVTVFEASQAVGGMAQTISLWGQKVDLGPHRFFSSDARVNRLWLEVAGDDYAMVDRLTRIYYRRRFFYYPLQPLNALWNMGIVEAARCVLSYLKEKALPSYAADDNRTFESWVVGRFGRRLFELFFKSYSEKLWGIHCDRLDADFAAQRIKKFSLGEAIKSTLGCSRGQHKTLVDRFAYPTGGTGMIYERMAEAVRRQGGAVHLGQPVLRMLQKDGQVFALETVDHQRHEFDHVISTMPLTLLLRGLDDVPEEVRTAAKALRFRNTVLVYLHVDATDLFADQWLYVHSPELRVGRITNFRNWVPQLYGDAQTSIVALEYWCHDDEPLWSARDERLVAQARMEAQATGLLGNAAVLDGFVYRVRRCYPVYQAGYKQHLDRVMDFVGGLKGITPIGRYGAFKYNNQDHSILMGILAAQNIADNAGHNLAAINTDYESYQESASIGESGLAATS
jgi:protoporphyrinogen oxidase